MKRCLLFLTFGLILNATIAGRTDTSSQTVDNRVVLTGTVYDINRSVIAFSQVLARSSRGREYQATTNTEGVYKIELPPEVYKIEVNAPGFCPTRVEMFRVRNSRSGATPLDVVLEVSEGDRPCKQKTMIKREPGGKEPKIRKPEIFRSIAE
jgi:hypothetical protein